MPRYEFDIVAHSREEVYKYLYPLLDRGLTVRVVTMEGVGGGNPTISVEGDLDAVREGMTFIGFDTGYSILTDEDFENIYRMRRPGFSRDR